MLFCRYFLANDGFLLQVWLLCQTQQERLENLLSRIAMCVEEKRVLDRVATEGDVLAVMRHPFLHTERGTALRRWHHMYTLCACALLTLKCFAVVL